MFHRLFINNSRSKNDYLRIIECTVLHFFYINVLYICAATHCLHITKYGLASNQLFTYKKITNGGHVTRQV